MRPSKLGYVIAPIFIVLATILLTTEALAEEGGPASGRLAGAISKLVPYDMEGSTLEALETLDTLAGDQNARVASTAQFIRAAAEVDILAFATLSDDSVMRDRLANALGTTPTEVREVVEGHLTLAAQGSFSAQIASSADVLSCLGADDWNRCGPLMRRVADSGGASATAARLFLLHRVIEAVSSARTASPEQGIAALVAQSRPLCAVPGRSDIARLCREHERSSAARMRLGEVVFQQAQEDLEALDRAGDGDDPLVALASSWVTAIRGRMGWLAFTQPLDATTISGVRLPDATSTYGTPPIELLVIGTEEVAAALAPTTIIHPSGPQRIGSQGDFALPGKTILTAPYGFRPVIRPIKQVTETLTQLRTQVDEAIGQLGGDGPDWLSSEGRVLGLVVDRGTTLVDLARYVSSARRAGYERFALFGRREDGQLAMIPASSGTMADGPTPANVPRLRVGPVDVSYTDSDGPPLNIPRREPERLGPAVVSRLNGSTTPIFAIQGRPMMTYGLVFPSIDAVVGAAQSTSPSCLFLLPP